MLTENQGDYLMRTAQDRTYGDAVTLQAASNLLQTQILVISSLQNGHTVATPNDNNIFDLSLPYIVVGHLAENQGEHYVCRNLTEEEIRTVIRSSPQISMAQTLVEDERNHNLEFSPLFRLRNEILLVIVSLVIGQVCLTDNV